MTYVKKEKHMKHQDDRIEFLNKKSIRMKSESHRLILTNQPIKYHPRTELNDFQYEAQKEEYLAKNNIERSTWKLGECWRPGWLSNGWAFC